jgi:hypothetical protein
MARSGESRPANPVEVTDRSTATGEARFQQVEARRLAGRLASDVGRIDEQERHPKTFPHDQFTDAFLRSLHAPAGENRLPASEAIKTAINSLGPVWAEIMDQVLDALADYDGHVRGAGRAAGQLAHEQAHQTPPVQQ